MQQAIDILDEMIKEYDHKMYLAFFGNPAIEIDKEAKAKLIEAKSRIQALGDGWIPVTERLPEEGCYLAFSDGIMYVTATGNDSIFWNAGEIVSGVTHWMPLPNSPKQ